MELTEATQSIEHPSGDFARLTVAKKESFNPFFLYLVASSIGKSLFPTVIPSAEEFVISI